MDGKPAHQINEVFKLFSVLLYFAIRNAYLASLSHSLFSGQNTHSAGVVYGTV